MLDVLALTPSHRESRHTKRVLACMASPLSSKRGEALELVVRISALLQASDSDSLDYTLPHLRTVLQRLTPPPAIASPASNAQEAPSQALQAAAGPQLHSPQQHLLQAGDEGLLLQGHPQGLLQGLQGLLQGLQGTGRGGGGCTGQEDNGCVLGLEGGRRGESGGQTPASSVGGWRRAEWTQMHCRSTGGWRCMHTTHACLPVTMRITHACVRITHAGILLSMHAYYSCMHACMLLLHVGLLNE